MHHNSIVSNLSRIQSQKSQYYDDDTKREAPKSTYDMAFLYADPIIKLSKKSNEMIETYMPLDLIKEY